MIDWKKFECGYVKLETGRTKRLKLTDWQEGSCFDTPGLRFSVTEEDSVPVNKVFSTTSRQVILALKPIIEKAESQGQSAISIRILKLGEGYSTLYEVTEDAISA